MGNGLNDNSDLRRSSIAEPKDIDDLLPSDNITIQQERVREVTVIIWKTKSKKWCIKDGDQGHGSILLRKEKQEDAFLLNSNANDSLDNKLYRYISFTKGVNNNSGLFLPSYIESMKMMMSSVTTNRLRKGKFSPNEKQKIIGVDPVTKYFPEESWMDIDDIQNFVGWKTVGHLQEWGTLANVFVNLPALDLDQIGLDMNRMVDWCIQHHSSEKFCYQYVSNRDNCVSVAWRALQAGGGEAFCKLGGNNPPSHFIYITAQNLHEYATFIRAGIQKSQTFYLEIKNKSFEALSKNVKLADKAPNGFALATSGTYGRLYTYEEWKKETTKAGIFGFRGKCADLDDTLKQYHQYEWRSTDPTIAAEQYSKKLHNLLTILKILQSFWQKKDNYITVEQPALVALSMQVCQQFEILKSDSLKPWSNINYYKQVNKDVVIPSKGNYIASKINKLF